jgi:hypothetical protein
MKAKKVLFFLNPAEIIIKKKSESRIHNNVMWVLFLNQYCCWRKKARESNLRITKKLSSVQIKYQSFHIFDDT